MNAENPHAGDTSQPANILIYCRVAKKDSGVQFQMNGKIYPDEFSFPAQQFYTPKATYEFSILIKAPLDEDLYANKVEICARIDSSLETCEPVWLRIIGAKDTPIPSPTQSPATQLTPFQAIVVIVSIVIAIGFVYWLAGDRNGKKKKKHSGQKK